jgi:hypothetical protein
MLDVLGKAHHAMFGVLAAAIALILHPALLAAVPVAPPVITSITVVTKPGKQSGRAMATVNGKTASIAANAVQAWTIQQGQGALLLLAPLKKGQPYRVRYYELDAGKSRLLGYVPFAQAKLAESKTTGPMWAFALNGVDPLSKESVIFAGDTEAIHARLDSASAPVFALDSLSFRSSSGPATASLPVLMGWDVRGVIFAPATTDPKAAYLEFLSDGDSLTIDPAAHVERGRWLTDGEAFRIAPAKGPPITWQRSALHPVSGIPAAHRLEVRLLQPLSSRTAKVGMEVHAVSIAPAVSAGSILIPEGSKFDGKIIEARAVGWGIRRETAALTVQFSSAELPDGRRLLIDARVLQVDNARELVSANGQIQGIRSTGTLGNSAENKISSLAQIDPVAYLFLSISGPAVLGFAEPEILYDAGTELILEFRAPIITSQTYQPTVTPPDLTGEQLAQFNTVVRELPYRTATQGTSKLSDITNLIFIGNVSSLRRAFDAAGWTTADQLTAASTFQTVKTLTGNQTYTQAPMSTLILGDEEPLFTLQKTTNTFSSRHHVRVFPTGESFDGKTVLTASSTQDIAIAFSYRQKTFIHVIDQYLDNERSKIVDDLDFTGCVDHVGLVSRPWVPQDAYNSTGDRLRTDGAAAAVFLNDCTAPRTNPTTPASRAGLFERSERNTMLTIKDQLYRGNVVYQGISGGIKVHHYLATQGELPEDTGHWQQSDASGTQYRVAGTAPTLLHRQPPWAAPSQAENQPDAEAQALIRSHRWDPPHYEIAIQGGYSRFVNSNLENVLLTQSPVDPNAPDAHTFIQAFADTATDGWAAGVSLTLNSWNWISNEFAYTQQQTKYLLYIPGYTSGSGPQEPGTGPVGLSTRQAEYNMLFHARPRKSRFRPYFAAGPDLQLIKLAAAPLKKPSGYFSLGLSNVGILQAAFNFGSVPPLDGGGIFQPGLQYGGGIKYRLLPRLTMRADVRENWSRNPKMIAASYQGYVIQIPVLAGPYITKVTNSTPPATYLQQRLTIGFAFTF